jgi:hypothetical protein
VLKDGVPQRQRTPPESPGYYHWQRKNSEMTHNKELWGSFITEESTPLRGSEYFKGDFLVTGFTDWNLHEDRGCGTRLPGLCYD